MCWHSTNYQKPMKCAVVHIAAQWSYGIHSASNGKDSQIFPFRLKALLILIHIYGSWSPSKRHTHLVLQKGKVTGLVLQRKNGTEKNTLLLLSFTDTELFGWGAKTDRGDKRTHPSSPALQGGWRPGWCWDVWLGAQSQVDKMMKLTPFYKTGNKGPGCCQDAWTKVQASKNEMLMSFPAWRDSRWSNWYHDI